MTILQIAVVLQPPDAGRPPNLQLVDATLGAHMIPHPKHFEVYTQWSRRLPPPVQSRITHPRPPFSWTM
ncbi:hypothetical protein HYDPIDRAFT_114525, partial [Hydnomerulius pinastri MD-312]